MAKNPAFLFYSNDFYEGTRTMLPEERAAYIDLMIYQHQHNGVIDLSPERLCLYCTGISKETIQLVLDSKFKKNDNGWINKKLNIILTERQEFASKQSINGTVGQFWKKAKATLNNTKYHKLRNKFNDYSNANLHIIIIEYQNKSYPSYEAMLEAMLQAKLKHLEDEDEIEDEIIDENKKLTWKEDFNVYLDGLRKVYNQLVRDKEFLEQQQKYYPNLNIKLTLEKACVNFWATEAGWTNKKKTKTKTINWKTTLTNAISQPQNKVYYERENGNSKNNKSAVSDNFKAEILRGMGVIPSE